MNFIFFAIEWAAIPLHILLAVIGVWYGYQFINARYAIRSTYFELERDIARNKQANAITAIIILIEIGVLIFGVQMRAVPYLESERDFDEQIAQQEAQQVRDGVFVTDTPQAVAQGIEFDEGTPLAESEIGFIPTPTLTPTPVGTILPNPPPTQGCVDEAANLQIPANGMRVFAPIPVRGTAFTDQFSSATIEISGPTTNNQFFVVDRLTAPILQTSDFSQFNPAGYEPGRYEFRLMVFDLRGDVLVASCLVNIYISAPVTTPTPTPRR